MADNEYDEILTAEEEVKMTKTAAHRAGFKIHVGIFILVNLFFWIVWYFLFKGKEDTTFFNAVLFVSIVWFVFVLGHYMIVYKWNKTFVEKELKQLKKERVKQLAEIRKLKEEEKKRKEARSSFNKEA